MMDGASNRVNSYVRLGTSLSCMYFYRRTLRLSHVLDRLDASKVNKTFAINVAARDMYLGLMIGRLACTHIDHLSASNFAIQYACWRVGPGTNSTGATPHAGHPEAIARERQARWRWMLVRARGAVA